MACCTASEPVFHRRHRLLGMLGLVTFVTGCSEEPRTASGHDISVYPIYAAALEELADSSWVETFVVAPYAGAPEEGDVVGRRMGLLSGPGVEVPENLASEFTDLNQERVPIEDSLEASIPVVMLEARIEDILRIDPNQGWQLILEQYPASALIRFSRPAVDTDGFRAFLYVELWCGPLNCAEGHQMLLRQEASGWMVEQHEYLWTS